MNWQVMSPYLLTLVTGFISGFGLAVTKGVSKIIGDIWTDHRNEKKRVKERKSQIVSQLLFDIPRGKSADFEVTMVKKSDGEQTIAQIAAYDKNMAKKVESYLNLWRRHASANVEFKNTNQVLIFDKNDDPESVGPEYLEYLLSQLNSEYERVIEILNKWRK
ncbi:hypothetical protein A2574_03155 [Candidatus Shapirobacteria bacterium RIFOXYD1_FULL_38_32]|uniref:Uncharacterized protein n=4 Tax=Patescibacteria group TaxID=1783273 RepID=A0A0G0MSC3_9BACT|nr:MAG: hypothetical protein US90_C0030G0002 [Candidatus Shapirobacteria bacterium GW2011_GWE2_38_30]KKQ91247.1 MAG: hypothetical protein UT14_C0018G0002 [Candidatus Shapirobacteria bacterium GW2011_GWE1_38_92]OGJ06439.1 MAG: hypothetical protein A2192_02480 [Candidatus Nomurabacteria bacterium RIFOXYA1_FULL_35_17]OGL56498.1 MAG: hypothetical protein A2367_02860 [Candidatus Shapirobacteria bacterium RIFOXYB1_FULL_38_38]OGL57826.1 MAG: hypothetical protein A2574_03155 [Candidatus Shapirobacteria